MVPGHDGETPLSPEWSDSSWRSTGQERHPEGFHEQGGRRIRLWGVFWGGKAAETSQHGNVGPFLRTAGGASPAL